MRCKDCCPTTCARAPCPRRKTWGKVNRLHLQCTRTLTKCPQAAHRTRVYCTHELVDMFSFFVTNLTCSQSMPRVITCSQYSMKGLLKCHSNLLTHWSWGHGSSSSTPTKQAQGPEFKLQYCQIKNTLGGSEWKALTADGLACSFILPSAVLPLLVTKWLIYPQKHSLKFQSESRTGY
jgi:hypothetical protein